MNVLMEPFVQACALVRKDHLLMNVYNGRVGMVVHHGADTASHIMGVNEARNVVAWLQEYIAKSGG